MKIFAFAVGASFVGILAGSSLAQTAPPKAPALTLQGSAEQSPTSVVKDAFGKPCLDIEAAARAHVANPDMLDHVVSVKNNCPRTIQVKACYFRSDRCNDFPVKGYGRVDSILGTISKVRYFRYSVFQK